MNDALTLRVVDVVTHAEIEDMPDETLIDALANDPLLDDYCFLGMAYGLPLSDMTMAKIRQLVAEAMIRQLRHDHAAALTAMDAVLGHIRDGDTV